MRRLSSRIPPLRLYVTAVIGLGMLCASRGLRSGRGQPVPAVHARGRARLSAVGLSLSVDDFGTGYSSLANLKRLPVDGIKIDKSFVIDMPHDQSDAAIVRSTIDLAHNLGLKVVAEGVESSEAWRRLEELGCDLAQGFHVSRPLPADALTRLLAERKTQPAQPEPFPFRVVHGYAS